MTWHHRTKVCIQLCTYADNVTLPAFPSTAAAIDWYLLLAGPVAAKLEQRVCCYRPMLRDRQTHVDRAPHTMQAVNKPPINRHYVWSIRGCGRVWFKGERGAGLPPTEGLPPNRSYFIYRYYRPTQFRCLIRCESKKQDTKLLPITSPNINRISIFFTDGLSSKFAANSCLNISPCLKRVATLPCVGLIWMSKNRINLK